MKSVVTDANDAVLPAHRLDKAWRLRVIQPVHSTEKSTKLRCSEEVEEEEEEESAMIYSAFENRLRAGLV